jgi:signal transduction histidine kinase
VERPTVLIISDDAEFARTISTHWQMERNSPAFLKNEEAQGAFDLAIVRGTPAAFSSLQGLGKPIIQVTRSNAHSLKLKGAIEVPEVEAWPQLVIAIARQILDRRRVAAELSRVSELKLQLEREASLGRYIVEMRHNLNNALTSILGNSELMLLDPNLLDPSLRQQVETIRNMGMRMNEILQRFSSLQKEMQLAEKQGSIKAARGAAAGQ